MCSQFEYSDMLMSYVLEKKWHQLFNSSLLRIEELQPMKQKFAEVTAKEVDNFGLKVFGKIYCFHCDVSNWLVSVSCDITAVGIR